MTVPLLPSRTQAVLFARQVLEKNPIYLDTETTGLDKSAEIVEISIVDDSGATLVESLVKPTQLIPAEAMAIHGITQEMVSKAPAWPILYATVRGVLYGRLIVIYNAEYDIRLMQQSHGRYRLPWKDTFQTVDLLKLYAEYRGEWDPYRRGYRFHSLDSAGKQCQISLPNAHRATADTLLSRALLHYIAENP